MNEFQAAMGLCNLRQIEQAIERRKVLYERYEYNLRDISGIRLNNIPKNIKYNYAYFPVIFENLDRNKIQEMLIQNDFVSRKYFYPLTSDIIGYKTDLKKARYICEHVLTLPLFSELKATDVDTICNLIKNFK
ncbi:hypothetical protein AN642_03130 [Epulopiscium sp. SCG-B10WGA-EpuloA2]|nr:hypothetical protein AN642_03130 [Epulopiscium sp. SCG-B10WGA-EpuloA2]